MTATSAADSTGAVTRSISNCPAWEGQVLVQVTNVPLAITKWIGSGNSMALLGIALASMEAQPQKETRYKHRHIGLTHGEHPDQVKPFLFRA